MNKTIKHLSTHPTLLKGKDPVQTSLSKHFLTNPNPTPEVSVREIPKPLKNQTLNSFFEKKESKSFLTRSDIVEKLKYLLDQRLFTNVVDNFSANFVEMTVFPLSINQFDCTDSTDILFAAYEEDLFTANFLQLHETVITSNLNNPDKLLDNLYKLLVDGYFLNTFCQSAFTNMLNYLSKFEHLAFKLLSTIATFLINTKIHFNLTESRKIFSNLINCVNSIFNTTQKLQFTVTFPFTDQVLDVNLKDTLNSQAFEDCIQEQLHKTFTYCLLLQNISITLPKLNSHPLSIIKSTTSRVELLIADIKLVTLYCITAVKSDFVDWLCDAVSRSSEVCLDDKIFCGDKDVDLLFSSQGDVRYFGRIGRLLIECYELINIEDTVMVKKICSRAVYQLNNVQLIYFEKMNSQVLPILNLALLFCRLSEGSLSAADHFVNLLASLSNNTHAISLVLSFARHRLGRPASEVKV